MVSGVTTVSPLENGKGWETLALSVTRTVRLPCATATVEICTSLPITIVPVRSSMTTRAGTSVSTPSSPMSARKRVGLTKNGRLIEMVRKSFSRATLMP